jgi:hypothetical protein
VLEGFTKIIEERILKARKEGAFDNLDGAGKPLVFEDDSGIPEELRLAYKILKNADCLPPEIEMKKEISRTEELLEAVEDASEKYRLLKKLNFMIMKLNTARNASIVFEVPQKYFGKMTDKLSTRSKKP